MSLKLVLSGKFCVPVQLKMYNGTLSQNKNRKEKKELKKERMERGREEEEERKTE